MNRCSAPNRRGGRSSAVPSRCTTRCCDRSSTKSPNAKRSGSGCAGIGSCSEMIQKSANDSAGKPSHCDGPMSTCTTLRGSDMPPLRHLLAVTALTASVATAAPQVDVLASGLSNPRGIAFAPNGQLFVTEAGRGGNGRCALLGDGQLACYGEAGALTRIDRLGIDPPVQVIGGLPSLAAAGGFASTGPHSISFSGTGNGRLVMGPR